MAATDAKSALFPSREERLQLRTMTQILARLESIPNETISRLPPDYPSRLAEKPQGDVKRRRTEQDLFRKVRNLNALCIRNHERIAITPIKGNGLAFCEMAENEAWLYSAETVHSQSLVPELPFYERTKTSPIVHCLEDDFKLRINIHDCRRWRVLDLMGPVTLLERTLRENGGRPVQFNQSDEPLLNIPLQWHLRFLYYYVRGRQLSSDDEKVNWDIMTQFYVLLVFGPEIRRAVSKGRYINEVGEEKQLLNYLTSAHLSSDLPTSISLDQDGVDVFKSLNAIENEGEPLTSNLYVVRVGKALSSALTAVYKGAEYAEMANTQLANGLRQAPQSTPGQMDMNEEERFEISTAGTELLRWMPLLHTLTAEYEPLLKKYFLYLGKRDRLGIIKDSDDDETSVDEESSNYSCSWSKSVTRYLKAIVAPWKAYCGILYSSRATEFIVRQGNIKCVEYSSNKKDTKMAPIEEVVKNTALAINLEPELCWSLFCRYLQRAKLEIPKDFRGALHSDILLQSLFMYCEEVEGSESVLPDFQTKSSVFSPSSLLNKVSYPSSECLMEQVLPTSNLAHINLDFLASGEGRNGAWYPSDIPGFLPRKFFNPVLQNAEQCLGAWIGWIHNSQHLWDPEYCSTPNLDEDVSVVHNEGCKLS